MCQAFSCLITRSGRVYWKVGVDSHTDLVELYEHKDPELTDDKLPPENTFARVEINPVNGNYLAPDQEWVLKLDDRVEPAWWNKDWAKPKCFATLKKWQKQVYSGINLKEARNPVHPFNIKPPRKITKQHIALLREWARVWASVWASVGVSVGVSVGDSVWASVGDSVRASVGARVWASVRDSVGVSVGVSVGDSVGASVGARVWASVWASVRASVGARVWASVRDSVGVSVGDSVGDSVWDSVGASVGAYQGSLFTAIKEWKYVDNSKPPFNKIHGYPYRSVVKLWKQGLVPSFDGKKWRLHGGKDGKILWEGEL